MDAMSLSDEDLALITIKIDAMIKKHGKYQIKSNEINEVVRALGMISGDNPRNSDCTAMTDEQIQTSKTNLLNHAEEILTWND